jgi:hypothetical protein
MKLNFKMGLFDFLSPKKTDVSSTIPSTKSISTIGQTNRQTEFPEQYPAVKNRFAVPVVGDSSEVKLLRPLLAATQLEFRKLQISYQASKDGWKSSTFHRTCNGKGAAVVVIKIGNKLYGGYNPKGWAGLGENRPSVAAFLFSLDRQKTKVCKIGGGGLAVSKDSDTNGIYFGPDALVIPLDGSKYARSRLGSYYENMPNGDKSIYGSSSEVVLTDVTVYHGVYTDKEFVPYTGGIFDMTSG